jgi:cobalt-zinc-cadmium efflux system protein
VYRRTGSLGWSRPRHERRPMAHSHDHSIDTIRHEGPLRWALALTVGFLVVELLGAWLSNSLALLSDAAHMATDTFALAIALAAVHFARRPPDARRTYGYARMEALGALFNGSLLVLLAAWILFEAVQRFRQPPEVATATMILVALCGLAVNLVAMRLLKAGSGESLNMKGAYLEVWSDMLGSVAVLIGAVVIRFTGWSLVDPLLAVAIGLWVLPRTAKLLREAVHLLLEGVPRGLDLAQVRAAIEAEVGVASVHDLHLWSVSSTQPLLSAHVTLADDRPGDATREQVAAMLASRFGIRHSTLQMESAPCATPPCGPAAGTPHEHPPGHDPRHLHG